MLPVEKLYTYADIEKTEDGKQCELLDGVLYLLASPSPFHGEISNNLESILRQYLGSKKCRVYHAPQDVFLFNRPDDPKTAIRTVVQPDVFVLCDRSQRTERGIFGAPTLAIEITSDSIKRNDRIIKYCMYQDAGVREYWLVDPAKRIVTVFSLDDAKYGAGDSYSAQDAMISTVFPDLRIHTADIFASW